ncbi:hypothetical protein [Mycolicibacterium sp.]|uniref:hypothetical protein n=1 Tax=Mycolicibacterium sp. TaxID=2320850 RepID=UPI00355D4E81
MKYSKVSGAVRWSGGTTILHRGQSADDDHPLVRERPDLWTGENPGADLRSRKRRPVERATRAPGEVRDTPRRGPGRPRKTVDPAEPAVETVADE